MEKRIILNNQETDFWLEDTGRLRNEKTKRWLKGGKNKGFHFYSLYFKGKQYILYTHRIVAEYFIENPEPTTKTMICHLDGNKLNNNYLNLKWISPKEYSHIIKILGKKNKTKKNLKQKITFLENYGRIAQFRNTPYYATEKGKILNLSKNIEIRLMKSGDYYRFSARYGLNKKFLVHRAVWEAFNGTIPKNFDIDHIDGNPANNNLNNLQAISHKDNIKKRKIDWSYVSKNFNQNK